jgi:Polyketide cyclase / dehydrase and lipid transport
MTRITGEIIIDAPADVVFDFVADQRNESAYNPQMVRSAKVTPGPVGKGTQFRSAVRSRGRLAEMTIEYTGFQRPSRLASTTRRVARLDIHLSREAGQPSVPLHRQRRRAVTTQARELNQTPSSLRCAASAARSRPSARSAAVGSSRFSTSVVHAKPRTQSMAASTSGP